MVESAPGGHDRVVEERRRLGRRAADIAGVDSGRPLTLERPANLYDADTGLASRTLFRDRTEHALNRAARNDGRVALLLLEIAAPATVADRQRDRRVVSQELAQHVRPEDTVAWLDDSYVGVLVEDLDKRSGVQRMRRRLEDGVRLCRGSSIAVSDASGRIALWMGGGAGGVPTT